MELDADVAVIGLGAMGSAALWRLARRGAQALGFEQFEPGHDRGSSHGESRIIRSAYFEGAMYVPLVRRAFALWRELEAESGIPLLRMTGALMIGAPESSVVAGAVASARAHSLAYEILDATQLGRRYPQHRLAPGEIAVYEEPAGVLLPEAAIGAALARAAALGATIHSNTTVKRVLPESGGVRIETDSASYRVRHAVLAAGPWMADLVPDARLPLTITRQVLTWFRPRDPRLFAPERFPVFIRELPGDRNRYGFPTLDGVSIKLAVHRDGAATTAQGIDRGVYKRDTAPIEAYAQEYLPDLVPEVIRAQVCMYTNTPDGHFVIDAVPGHPQLTLLSCCSGHGFKFAAAIGDIAADLAISGNTAYPIAPFRLARLAESPGGPRRP